MSDETELAWAAGFFDGEGSFSGHGRQMVAVITQVDRRPLDRFQAAVAIGTVLGPYDRPKARAQHRWTVASFAGVRWVGALLAPYLSEPKIEQFEASMARRASIPLKPSSAHPGFGEANIHAKLTWAIVDQIRAACAGGQTQRAVGSDFGISPGHVSMIIRARRCGYRGTAHR